VIDDSSNEVITMRPRDLSSFVLALLWAFSHAWNTLPKTGRRDCFHKLTSFGCVILSTTGLPPSANAVYSDPKTGVRFPEEGEISMAIPTDWTGVENPLDGDEKNQLSRLDKTPDSEFYSDPRFVEHVDENAVILMTEYITTQAVKTGDSVLDLCSSWTSHLDINRVQPKRMAGLGMNSKELSANPALTEWTVSDLNANPKLPYEDASFSVALCQLSIDYLSRPLDVLKEVGRVLQPGGRVYILFSNRLFIQKAVALWTGADDIDHAYTVGCYLHFSGGGFQDIVAEDLSKRKGSKIAGDPMYVVHAIKA
jgi:Methyltransferase domain